MSEVLNHFLKYVSYDTESKEDVEEFPSTESQRVLAEVLAEELRAMHAQDVRVDQNSYVYATIPATMDLIVSGSILGSFPYRNELIFRDMPPFHNLSGLK